MSGLTKKINSKDRATWLKAREGIVTATKMIRLLGGRGLACFLDVVGDLRGGHVVNRVFESGYVMRPTPLDENMPMLKWGREMEEKVFVGWHNFYPHIDIEYPGSLYVTGCGRWGATPDWVSTDGRWVGEIKTAWSRDLPADVWGIPDAYLLQVLHQLYCTGAEWALLLFAFPSYTEPSNMDRARMCQFVLKAPTPSEYERLVLNDALPLLRDPHLTLLQLESHYQTLRNRTLNFALQMARRCVVAFDPDVSAVQACHSRPLPPFENTGGYGPLPSCQPLIADSFPRPLPSPPPSSAGTSCPAADRSSFAWSRIVQTTAGSPPSEPVPR